MHRLELVGNTRLIHKPFDRQAYRVEVGAGQRHPSEEANATFPVLSAAPPDELEPFQAEPGANHGLGKHVKPTVVRLLVSRAEAEAVLRGDQAAPVTKLAAVAARGLSEGDVVGAGGLVRLRVERRGTFMLDLRRDLAETDSPERLRHRLHFPAADALVLGGLRLAVSRDWLAQLRSQPADRDYRTTPAFVLLTTNVPADLVALLPGAEPGEVVAGD